jgi:hypothetical protein
VSAATAIKFSFLMPRSLLRGSSLSVVIGLYASEKTGNSVFDITNWRECQMVVAFMF